LDPRTPPASRRVEPRGAVQWPQWVTASAVRVEVAYVRQPAEIIAHRVEPTLDVQAVREERALYIHLVQPEVLSLAPIGLVLNVGPGIAVRGGPNPVGEKDSDNSVILPPPELP